MGRRTFVGNFIHNTWTNLNIRAGKYRHLQTRDKCKSYDDIKILFTLQEFKDWCWDHEDLIRSLERPSLDRLDNTENYILSNIQIIELAENIAKEKRKGTLNEGPCYSCNKVKPKKEFNKESRRWSKFSSICKLCDKKRKIKTKSSG